MTNLCAHHQDILSQSLINAAVEAEEFNLVSLLKPSVAIDGDKWCVLYGGNLMTGIAGFGETPYLAVLDFNRNWSRKIGEKP